MTGPAATAPRLRWKPAVWLLVAAGFLFIAAANAHLVYVAVTSQPACVAHVRSGEAAAGSGSFSAARSACAPVTKE